MSSSCTSSTGGERGVTTGPSIVQAGRRSTRWCAVFLVLACAVAPQARAQELTAREIVDRVENLLWGKTVDGEYEMTITTPRWQRTLVMHAWMDRPKRSFIRILAP